MAARSRLFQHPERKKKIIWESKGRPDLLLIPSSADLWSNMLRIDNLNENKVLPIRGGGKLHEKDYQQLLPEPEKLLNQHDTLHCFVQLENFPGFDTGALRQDIQCNFQPKDQDEKWKK